MNSKKSGKRFLSMLLTLVMVLGLFPNMAFAAEAAPKTGTAKVTMMHETKDQPSMCDVMFDETAELTENGDNVEMKLKVAYPVPAYPDQGTDGTVKNFAVSYKDQTYTAESDITSKPMMTVKKTNEAFGLKQGDKIQAQVLTVTLPKTALEEKTLAASAFVNVIMMTDVSFRVALNEITWNETSEIEPGVVVFDPAPGAVAKGTKVALKAAEGAEIIYEFTDSAIPEDPFMLEFLGTPYTEPLTIDKATNIQAMVKGEDQVFVATYFIEGDKVLINSENFPDYTFKAYVKENFDKDASGGLSDEELAAVTSINLESLTDSKARSLEGCKLFPNVETIYCRNHQIKTLDVSGMEKLQQVVVSGNGMKELNVNGCTSLVMIDSDGNDLRTLDLSTNTALFALALRNNQMTSIDLSNKANITADTLNYIAFDDNNMMVQDGSDLTEINPLFDNSKVSDTDGGTIIDNVVTFDEGSEFITYNYDSDSAKGKIAFTLTKDTNPAIDAVNFPDPVFREYVKDNFDTDGSNSLSPEETAAVTDIGLSFLGEDKKITSLEGCKLFPNVTMITCSDHPIKALDVSGMEKLQYLTMERCGMDTLNVTGCTGLMLIAADGNNLKTLDLTTNTSLAGLSMRSNQMTSIDLSNKENVSAESYAFFDDNNLSIKNGTDLTKINPLFDTSKVSELDGGTIVDGVVTFDEGFEFITYNYDTGSPKGKIAFSLTLDTTPDGIVIDEANFPDAVFREYVTKFDTDKDNVLSDAERMEVKSISVQGPSALHPDNKEVSDLTGIEHFPEITNVSVSDCESVTKLDLSKNMKVQGLSLSCTGITTMDNVTLGDNEKLTHLSIWGTDEQDPVKYGIIGKMDATKYPNLATLMLGFNEGLTDLDISNNTKLKTIWLPDTRLSSLNTDNCPELNDLNISSPDLVSADVTKNKKLTKLDIGSKLDKLDLTQNTELEWLMINHNNLTDIDLSHNTKLEIIWINDNELTTLDVSMLPALTTLAYGNNHITGIDLSKNPNLSDIDGTGNTLVVENGTDLKSINPAFVSKNAVNVKGGKIVDGIVTFDEGSNEISYRYKTGNGSPVLITLTRVAEPVKEYPIEGAQNGTYLEDGSLQFKIKADAAKLENVIVDQHEVAKDQYTVADHVTVTLKPEFIKTLAKGNHAIEFKFSDGIAKTDFPVTEGETSTVVFGTKNVELAPGIYHVPVAFMHAQHHDEPSKAADCLNKIGTLIVKEDGSAEIKLTMKTLGMPADKPTLFGNARKMSVYQKYDITGEVTEAKVEATRIGKATPNFGGSPLEYAEVPAIFSFTLPYHDQDGIYVNLVVDATGEMNPDAFVAIDFENAKGVTTHQVTVENGLGSGAFAAEDIVFLKADDPAEGKVFDKWVGEGVVFEDASAVFTNFVMPAEDIAVKATYKNDPDAPEVLAAPVIDPNGGKFTGKQEVKLSAAEGAEIHYTTDGTDPTADSALYEGPFTITKTTTVKAVAVKEDVLSEIASAEFTKKSGGGGGSVTPSKPVEPEKPTEPEVPVEPEKPVQPEAPVFKDVPADFWAKDSIDTVVARKLFAGTSETTFGPKEPVTRAMFVTVLGRLAGVDVKAGDTKFSDVPADQYYAPYVAWAVENGIVAGTSETTFAPNRPVSRQEMAVFLVRYANFAKIELKDGTVPDFKDAASIQAYAKDAVMETAAAGLLKGNDDGTFAPLANASRAEVAALMARFIAGYDL